jgi:RNA polymerase primary sigma factor
LTPFTRTIRIPVHMVERLNKVVQAERRLVQQLGREPDADEIAAELEVSADEVREIVGMARVPVSLERPVGEDGQATLGEFVEDESAESPLELAALALRRRALRDVLDALPGRERQVLELRFGLDGAEPRTLEQVGHAFGVTRERIRQIETSTLKQLAALQEAQALRDGP